MGWPQWMGVTVMVRGKLLRRIVQRERYDRLLRQDESVWCLDSFIARSHHVTASTLVHTVGVKTYRLFLWGELVFPFLARCVIHRLGALAWLALFPVTGSHDARCRWLFYWLRNGAVIHRSSDARWAAGFRIGSESLVQSRLRLGACEGLNRRRSRTRMEPADARLGKF